MPIKIFGNRYRVIHVLGQGGMGTVYKVYDRLTNQHVALKHVNQTSHPFLVSSSGSGDPRVLLANEFKVLSAMRHPNIISVLDFGFDEKGRPFYTMELVEPFTHLLAYASQVDFVQKIRLLLDVLQGLSYLHRHNIIHNDLKPSNILVGNDGKAKIVDFGLALERNLNNNMRGTLGYMAPEVMKGNSVTEATDLYSLGVLTYEMFAGQRPFTATEIARLVVEVLQTPANLDPIREAINPEMANWVGNLLAKNPEDRYSKAQYAMEALCNAMEYDLPIEPQDVRDSYLRAAPFVGRKTEMQWLTQAFSNLRQGSGCAFLIGGESGIGKSRLLEEFRTYVLVNEAIVLKGQGIESGGLPYQIWRDLVRRLVLAVEISDGEATSIKALIPDIDTLLERTTLSADHSEGWEQRLLRTLRKIFVRQTRPIVVIVDDLQWATDSLLLLNEIAKNVSNLRVMIVGAYRSDEAPFLYGKLANFKLLMLERFNEHDIALLSEAILGRFGRQAKLVNMLKTETEGNLFFIVEVIRSLSQQLNRMDNLVEISIPRHIFTTSILEVVQRRLQRLHLDFQPMLRIAAVIGRVVDLNILEAIDEEFDYTEWLQACVNANIFEFVDDRWRFTHDKLREGILATLAPKERAKLHRMVAVAIENIYPNNPDYQGILQEHWHYVGDNDREMVYVRQLAQRKLDSGQLYVANDYFLRALNLIHPDDTDEQLTIYLQLGEIATLLGRFEEGETYYALAKPLATPDSFAYGKLLYGYGRIERENENYTEAATLLEHALTLFRGHHRLAWERKTLIQLGQCSFENGEFERSTDYFSLALQTIDDEPSPLGKATIYIYLGMIAHYFNHLDDALEHTQYALRLANELEHTYSINLATIQLALIYHAQNNLDRASEAYLQAYELAQQNNDTPRFIEVAGYYSRYCVLLGRLEYAQALLVDGLQQALKLNNRSLLGRILIHVAWYYDAVGQSKIAFIILHVASSQPHLTMYDKVCIAQLHDMLRAKDIDERLEYPMSALDLTTVGQLAESYYQDLKKGHEIH